MNFKTKAIVIIDARGKGNRWYPSISEAARWEPYSRQQLSRALASDSGEIPGVRPIVTVDEPAEETTEAKIDEFYQSKGYPLSTRKGKKQQGKEGEAS